METKTSAYVKEGTGPYIGEELTHVLECGVGLTHLYISQQKTHHETNENWRIPKARIRVQALQKLVIDSVDYKKTNILLQNLRSIQLHCLHINFDENNHEEYKRQLKLYLVISTKEMYPHTIHFNGVKQNDIPYVQEILTEYSSHRLYEVGFFNSKCKIDINSFKFTGHKIVTDNLGTINWTTNFHGAVCIESKNWDVLFDDLFKTYTNISQITWICKLDDKDKFVLKYQRHQKSLIMTKSVYEKHGAIYNAHKFKQPDLNLIIIEKRADYAIYL